MTERFYVAAKKKIERFDLVRVLLAFVQMGQGFHHCRTADCHTPDGGRRFEPQSGCWQTKAPPNNAQPCLPNTFTFLPFGINGIQPMAEAVLAPSVLFFFSA